MTRVPGACTSRARATARRLATFAIGGAILFGIGRAMPPPDAPRPTVEVGIPPGAPASRIDRAIEEAVLVDAALELGLPWSDPFVRARLVADVRATDPSAVELGDDEILAHARRLDLVRTHPVVRARVAEAMRRRLEHGAAIEAPEEAELSAYLHGHADRYARPTSLDVRQIFLSAARRGDDLDDAARALAHRLDGAALDDADTLGDPTLVPRDLVGATPRSLDATLGPGAGEAIAALPAGRWAGPIRGAYGMHVVFVRARRPGGLPALGEIEGRVRADLVADRKKAARERGIRALRERVHIALRETEGTP